MKMKNAALLKDLGFGREVERVRRAHCPICGMPIDHSKFEDELSKKEYRISGMCQACQDKMFGGDDD